MPRRQGELQGFPVPTSSFSLPSALTSYLNGEWGGWRASRPLTCRCEELSCALLASQSRTSAGCAPGYGGQMWVSLANGFVKVLSHGSRETEAGASFWVLPRWTLAQVFDMDCESEKTRRSSFFLPAVITMPINTLNIVFKCVMLIYPRASFSSLLFLLTPLGCI